LFCWVHVTPLPPAPCFRPLVGHRILKSQSQARSSWPTPAPWVAALQRMRNACKVISVELRRHENTQYTHTHTHTHTHLLLSPLHFHSSSIDAWHSIITLNLNSYTHTHESTETELTGVDPAARCGLDSAFSTDGSLRLIHVKLLLLTCRCRVRANCKHETVANARWREKSLEN